MPFKAGMDWKACYEKVMKEGDEQELCFTLPLRFRWSGEFVGKDANWKHLERQLVDYELIIMEKGTLYIENEQEKYEVQEGEYLIMAPTKMQRGYKPSKCRFYWMHFLMEDQPERRDGEKCDPQALRLARYGKLRYPERLYVMMRQLQACDLQYMDGLYNGYLSTAILLEIHNQQRQFFTATRGIREKVDDYLVERMNVPVSVGELARHFGYHEKYFCLLFKRQTGLSVKKYVDEKKMERAKNLLLNTDAYVAEIAEYLGYANIQNFYHVFKGTTNCTPTEFRNLYR